MSYKMSNNEKLIQMTDHHIKGLEGIDIIPYDKDGKAKVIFRFENSKVLYKWLDEDYREETKKDD